MLPAQYRMTRSTDFGLTVSRGLRAAQPDLVVHALVSTGEETTPKIGLVVSKSVGSAVQRHRVSRMLRHVARGVIDDLGPGDKVVIRALPGSRHAISARLAQELHTALQRVKANAGGRG
ncbi:ribonuclease P protein component [Mycolicibacterium madagascariense]|uniref:Ribonuclease P protein component n=1 Tax=Mycolicibacterium madagascariense TaxID=212765 RepID=A0A7I7XPH6_9MYCO|nr:ribonuclease P protein component [Mycolicibacterium madagascariense]MCV7014114.1 ribonuclease P protein component [Mycolicibacterium madagascariense]BBZ25716.1 ribonuclease P protein component [Mycolicibacterium madagascariense]BBZ31139.1 ribonuclease P protein component [Mycolicibacterium madagascariense]